MTLTALAEALSVLSENGLTISPAKSLIALKEGPQTMSKLAKVMGHSTAGATGIIDGLYRKGLVERNPDRFDRRLIYASLSSGGRSLLAAIEKQLSSVN